MTYQIEQLINDSVREDAVPTIEVRIDTQEWVQLVNDLCSLADGWVRITEGDSRISGEVVDVREYWGTDVDGDAWRVHVHASEEGS